MVSCVERSNLDGVACEIAEQSGRVSWENSAVLCLTRQGPLHTLASVVVAFTLTAASVRMLSSTGAGASDSLFPCLVLVSMDCAAELAILESPNPSSPLSIFPTENRTCPLDEAAWEKQK